VTSPNWPPTWASTSSASPARTGDPISCPVLAVGAQAYLGDQVSRQLAQVASDVRGVVIPASGHNIALENPAALAQAYPDFFTGR
jgi:pimeloyl-ACP methyl ester carboxylesterase